MGVSWGAEARPKQGQSVSGDCYLIERFDPAGLQVAVIDGLGGGNEAAVAAQAALSVVRNALDLDPTRLMQLAHKALQGTRGAVMALMTFDLRRRSVSYVGVGNIGTQVYSTQPIKPISKNGIVGYRMPPLLKLVFNYNYGDTFVIFSDGISSRFNADTQIDPSLPPQSLAELIMRHHGKSNDDATVVVIRLTE